MEELELRRQVVATGPELLREGLVARTWGNVSARVDVQQFLITPSGRDYAGLTEADIVLCNRVTGACTGRLRPSSERGIHAIAYELFPEVGFVIHTHQIYATALGLAGFAPGCFTGDERVRLGGVALAGYGLSGSKKLQSAIRAAMARGAHTILMPHHGALICGRDRADALERARLLERVARRNWKGILTPGETMAADRAASLLAKVRYRHPNARLVQTGALLTLAELRRPLRAQLDDMAQMIGPRLTVTEGTATAVERALDRGNAVLVPGLGAVVCGKDSGDSEALALLTDKAAVCALHVHALGASATLGAVDALGQHWVYVHKYSRRKEAQQ